MVAYLQKPEGSEGFHQIVNFLNAYHIRYALTENPTIYISVIKQFWQTATARTLDNGEIELNATIDGKIKIVTEASVRRHLKLADSDGISSLPTTEIFEQLSLMGNMKRASKGYSGEDIPLFPSMLATQAVEGKGLTQPTGPQHTSTTASPSHVEPIPNVASSSQPKKTHKHRKTKRKATKISQSSGPTTPVGDETIYEERGNKMERATTTTFGLEKVKNLESDLKQTKQIYGAAYTKLIKKRIRGDASTTEPVSTAGAITTTSVVVSTARPTRTTADDITMAETLVYIRKSAAKDKCI
ncbi:hypothetical protein Tco_1027837, partial [Tanacetum coccineum]